MIKTVRVDFYEVQMPAGCAQTFESFIDHAAGLSAVRRPHDWNHHKITLYECGHDGDYWEGNLGHIRLTEIPYKGKPTGPVCPIPLDKDEGLVEQTAFLYHVSTRVLALQVNRYAVNTLGVLGYFCGKSSFDDAVTPAPILNIDAVQRLARMQELRKFEIALARVDQGKPLSRKESSIGSDIDLMNHFHANKISICLSAGRKNTLANVVDYVYKLMRRKPSYEVQKLLVTGSDAQQITDVVDLIRDRIQEHLDVKLTDRVLPYVTRQMAIRQAWDRRKSEILKLMKAKAN